MTKNKVADPGGTAISGQPSTDVEQAPNHQRYSYANNWTPTVLQKLHDSNFHDTRQILSVTPTKIGYYLLSVHCTDNPNIYT